MTANEASNSAQQVHPSAGHRLNGLASKPMATDIRAGRKPAKPRGFSLMELLVVMGVISMLSAILLPSLYQARAQAKRMTCLSNQRQIALAMHAYAQDYDGRFPIAQYFDTSNLAFVAWDTITYAGTSSRVEPGLVWQYITGNKVQQCPSYEGPSMTTGDPYTGYNYNTTYIGRGRGEGDYLGMGESPARLAQVQLATSAALVGDGGWKMGANKFMRAPLDGGVPEGLVHAGAQAYRHLDQTNVVYVDGHGNQIKSRFRKPGASSFNEPLLDWPKNGFLSPDDSAYAHR